MKKEKFNTFFKSNILNEKEKLTIVLGSGFHKLDNNNTVLSSWDLLLRKVYPKFESQGNYLLDFEKIIINQSTSLQAGKVEKQKLLHVASFIKKEQENISEEQLKQYPIEIFNPKYVTDIIILNFDEVAERICKKFLNCKISNVKHIVIDKKLTKEAKIHQTTRYTEVQFPSNEKIRFWHPHGSIAKSSEMILSARSYATHIANIERLRKHSKSAERNNKKLNTWYDQLTHQPVLILGASISDSEWDLWSAFVNRARNFYKGENQKNRQPIYQMRSNEDKKCIINGTNQQWFQELYSEKTSYNDQWAKLKNLLK